MCQPPPLTPVEIRKTKPSVKVATLLHKLDWTKDGEWSAYLKPDECELLSLIVRDYYERLNA